MTSSPAIHPPETDRPSSGEQGGAGTLWRFHYEGSAIIFACPQAVCMLWAHRFGKYMGRKLVSIEFVKHLQPKLDLA